MWMLILPRCFGYPFFALVDGQQAPPVETGYGPFWYAFFTTLVLAVQQLVAFWDRRRAEQQAAAMASQANRVTATVASVGKITHEKVEEVKETTKEISQHLDGKTRALLLIIYDQSKRIYDLTKDSRDKFLMGAAWQQLLDHDNGNMMKGGPMQEQQRG